MTWLGLKILDSKGKTEEPKTQREWGKEITRQKREREREREREDTKTALTDL